ncbi:protein-glutamate O-methyltransferase CheR [Herbaspirillum sp. SJZ107]|uniref:CheR family methyltransferase n=1 Tax=Herbaspirillum sp. SJZ107 TaxID=2572881 RepID=UPI00114FA101|nr:protein-glutamate O-methyltransferase CheR [Herbaspirillum sp. SJZ107]TQK11211.1 chemotaxis methyl-accepting protein methylase [Herbaspirillum sp. SJZ107]
MPSHDPAAPPSPASRPDSADDALLQQVQALLRERTGHDFSKYKQGTILRRIERRMRVRGMRDLHAYCILLDEDRDEAGHLLQDLLIGVTSFFRDRDEFAAFEHVLLPQLFHGKGPADEVRAWTVACSTGEEAYSLAMLLHERAAAMAAPPALQLFATDVDRRAIVAARAGAYPAALADDIPPALLQRYVVRDGAQIRIQPALREAVLFAEHDLLRDPPFSRLDLISCRNLLIYLDRDAHRQVLAMFHFALKPSGYLFLGSAETADAAPDLFAPVDARHRLY